MRAIVAASTDSKPSSAIVRSADSVAAAPSRCERGVEHDQAAHSSGSPAQQLDGDRPAVGVADDVDPIQPERVERVEEVGHVLSDRPRTVGRRAAVTAQVDGHRVPLGPRLLGEPAVAPPVGGDAVDREQRFAGRVAEVVLVQDAHPRRLRIGALA